MIPMKKKKTIKKPAKRQKAEQAKKNIQKQSFLPALPSSYSSDKEEKVSKIQEGTVIDHISPETLFKVVEILRLNSHPDLVSIATNLPSKKMGKKAIIKIEKRFLTEEEVNRISVFTPDATVSIIKAFAIKEKGRVKVPDAIENVIKCSNPSCISNHEKIHSKFNVIEKDPLRVVCSYCERPMTQAEIELV